MAEEHKEEAVSVHESEGEVTDRGLFDFLGKKETGEKKAAAEEEEYLAVGVQNIHIEEGHKAHEGKEKEEERLHELLTESEGKKEEEEKHHGVVDKLHRSHSSSSSSSSSDEEEVEGEGGIKEKIKKKKKALKEKIEGIVHSEKHEEKEEKHQEEEKRPAFVPCEPVEEPKVVVEEVEFHESVVVEEEKKGFLEKIKEKLPGHSKKPAEEGVHVPYGEAVEVTGEHVKVHEVVEGPEVKEKKGFIGKIIEKLPGYHKSTGEETDKGPASH